MPRDRPYQELGTNEKSDCCTKVSVNASRFGQIRRRPASFGLRSCGKSHIPLPVLHDGRMPALFTGSAAWFYLGPRTSTLFRSILRVTRTLTRRPLISSRSRNRYTSLQSHGMRPSPWRRSPPIHSLSTSSVHFEKAKLHKPLVEKKKTASAIGAVLIRTYERKAETNHSEKKVLATESRLAPFGPLQTDRWFIARW